MTQLLEKIAGGTFGDTELKCPFKEGEGKDVNEDPENIAKDDRNAVVSIQANNGGTLGENLEAGRHSADGGTFNDIPQPAPSNRDVDAWRRLTTLHVPFTATLTDEYGPAAFMQPDHSSAHHLIPGNASLAASDIR